VGAWLGPPFQITGMQNSGNDGVRALEGAGHGDSCGGAVREIPGFLGSRDPRIAGIGMEGCGRGTVDDRMWRLCTSVSSG
jgi:hypothetical protein